MDLITHVLKIDNTWYRRVALGEKTAEIWLHDRDFQVGDRLILRARDFEAGVELAPIEATITHILPAHQFFVGLKKNYCLISFQLC